MAAGREEKALVGIAEAAYWQCRSRLENAFLERRYGFPKEASRVFDLAEIGYGDAERNPYGGSPWGVLGLALRREEVSANDVLLDVGCGMGRLIIEAARYPFQRVIGVDVVPAFTDVARSLVARNRRRLRCPDIEIVNVDATNYQVPDDVTVAYLGNPFEGEVRAKVIANLVASVDRRPRRMLVVYGAPPVTQVLEGLPRLRFVRYGRRRLRRWVPATDLEVYEIEQ